MSDDRRALDPNVESALAGFDALALSSVAPESEPTAQEIAAALGATLRLVGLVADALIRTADGIQLLASTVKRDDMPLNP